MRQTRLKSKADQDDLELLKSAAKAAWEARTRVRKTGNRGWRKRYKNFEDYWQKSGLNFENLFDL